MNGNKGSVGKTLTKDQEYYIKNKERVLKRVREYRKNNLEKTRANVRKVQQRYRDRRRKLIKLHGDKCKDCEYTYHDEIYEFHHRVPDEKTFNISATSMSKPWEVIMIEASKVDMLCCNCHRARHILMKQEGRTHD